MIRKIKYPERRILHLLIIVFSIMLVILSIIGDKGMMDYHELEEAEVNLKQEIQNLEKEKAYWLSMIHHMKTKNSYIETMAREKLGLVKKDEIVLKLEWVEATDSSVDTSSK